MSQWAGNAEFGMQNAESGNHNPTSRLFEDAGSLLGGNGNHTSSASPFASFDSHSPSPASGPSTTLLRLRSVQVRTGHQSPVSLIVVGEPGRINALRAAVLADARFQLLASATSVDDVRSKLALEPEAVLVGECPLEGGHQIRVDRPTAVLANRLGDKVHAATGHRVVAFSN